MVLGLPGRPVNPLRRVYARVAGSTINEDGRTPSLTMPSGDRQIELLQSLQDAAAVRPEQIVYVEAHGTGTPVGDPIEAHSISAAVRGARAGQVCIGSAKGTFRTSGVGGRHRWIHARGVVRLLSPARAHGGVRKLESSHRRASPGTAGSHRGGTLGRRRRMAIARISAFVPTASAAPTPARCYAGPARKPPLRRKAEILRATAPVLPCFRSVRIMRPGLERLAGELERSPAADRVEIARWTGSCLPPGKASQSLWGPGRRRLPAGRVVR